MDQSNGGENILAEGVAAFDRNLAMNIRSFGGTGPLLTLSECPAAGNFVLDATQDGPGGIWLWGVRPQTGNRFNGVETAGRIYLGPLATGNRFDICGVRYSAPSRGNQSDSDPTQWDALTAVTALAPGNTFTDGRFFLGDGLKAARGIALSRCQCNGMMLPDTTPAK